MAKQGLESKWIRIRVSSSIANFKDKAERRLSYEGDYTLFLGLYHWIDYLKFLLTLGKKRVLWCGSDILNLNKFWAFILKLTKAEHICENQVEQGVLSGFGIEPRVQPVLLTNPKRYKRCFRPSKYPEVFVNCHEGRTKEYGLETIIKIAPKLPEVLFHIYGIEPYDPFLPNNIVFHGKVSESEFDKDIKQYQGALRLNLFDGFGEVLAKSILMGQYPISKIQYPGITSYVNENDLITKIRALKYKKKPNPQADLWRTLLSKKI
ncbi:hypothetical protein M0R04_10875 [Candidatus Dojkabacteria bacterium]|jgi:hypothetical protein|nr:hypothetical protein [Candidatus Dojkabacteria bacterium]